MQTILSTNPESVVTHLPDGIAAKKHALFSKVNYITLKITQGCNLQCAYCNMEAEGVHSPKMSLEMFARIAETFFANTSSPHVGLEFHGGEPLIIGDDWLKMAVAIGNDLAHRYGKALVYKMQTNGVLLTGERLELLRSLGITFGISCDGPPDIHNRKRQSGAAVERAIRLARANGGDCSVLLVMSKSNFAEMFEIMDYFRLLGLRGFRFNFMQPQGWGAKEELLTAEEMFFGATECFRHMEETDCSVTEAHLQRLINRMVRGRRTPSPLGCWEHHCQAGRTYVAIDHSGAIYACGTDVTNHRLGHVDEPDQIDGARPVLARLHKKDAWHTKCFDCSARQICAHSCATSNYTDLTYRDNECSFTKQFYAFLLDRFDAVTQMHDRILSRQPSSMFLG